MTHELNGLSTKSQSVKISLCSALGKTFITDIKATDMCEKDNNKVSK